MKISQIFTNMNIFCHGKKVRFELPYCASGGFYTVLQTHFYLYLLLSYACPFYRDYKIADNIDDWKMHKNKLKKNML